MFMCRTTMRNKNQSNSCKKYETGLGPKDHSPALMRHLEMVYIFETVLLSLQSIVYKGVIAMGGKPNKVH